MEAFKQNPDEKLDLNTFYEFLSEYIEYLNIVKNTMTNVDMFDTYVQTLLSLSVKRKLFNNVDDFKDKIINSDLSPEELAEAENNTLQQIVLQASTKEFEINNLGSKIDVFLKEAAEQKRTLLGISTGYPQLDSKIEGLRKGALSIVCAPKKTGKTAFLMNIGVNVGIKQKIPTLMISTEMSDNEIMWRIISNLSQVYQNKILKGNLSDKDKKQVEMAALQFKQGKFFHVTIRNFTMEKIIGVVRKFIAKEVGYDNEGKIKDCLVLFDYIKMPQADLKKDLKEHKLLGILTDGLKMLAGDLQIPVISACQTNRAGDIANSYEITWFCDTFMELTKKSDKEMHNDSMNEYKGNQRLKISANRSGEEDSTGLDFEYTGAVLTYQEIDSIKR